MAFFDFLFGSKKQSNVEVIPDHIWMTTDAKFTGLTKDAQDRSRSGAVEVLLVAHFPDVLARLEQIASQKIWTVPCRAIPASHLNQELAVSLRLGESAIIDIVIGERHPLPSADDQLREFAGGLPCRCRISQHLSLEDPVIKAFAGDWVKDMLKKLGMRDDEAIESQMVSRRIRRAQQKIKGRSFGSLHADSAAEWLELNCPELSQD